MIAVQPDSPGDDYRFEPRLAAASTPPARWYGDPAMLAAENERVFARTWQLAARLQQLAAPGDYATATIAGEPLLLTHGKDGVRHALSNVCRHRAGPVAAGAGNRKAFQCGYHGWSYGLDGALLATPEFDGAECFSREKIRLPEFRLETWMGLVFVNLDPAAAPLAETMAGLEDRLGSLDLSAMRFTAHKEWTLDCNWKVYVDNYLEGYHIPIVHPGLFREIDYAAYRTETARFSSEQHSPIKANASRLRRQVRETPEASDRQPGLIGQTGKAPDGEARFFWIFPNLMLNVYPDNYSTNLIVPLGPEQTLTIFEWYFRDPDDPEVRERARQTIEFSDEIQLEDIAICEAVQRGLRSRTYTSGRYSVKRENGVHHFHGLLAEFLQGQSPRSASR